MTDITELAQREKFEAWAEERCALPWGYLKNRRTNTGYFSKHDYTSLWAAWKAAGAELVEALEKAQQRIAELESRTVTVKQYDEFQICHYGATEDYAKGYIDCQNNFSKWLTAAGIKWEAE
ncbi:TPA: hypothetical protein ACTXE5_003468 [Raoultella ornithinolytica]